MYVVLVIVTFHITFRLTGKYFLLLLYRWRYNYFEGPSSVFFPFDTWYQSHFR